MRKAKWIYAGVLVLASGWLSAVLAAPNLMCSGYEWCALILYRTFALICHQQRERSFHWCSWPLAVCVRCTGIYAGAMLGLLIYPWWGRLDVARLPAKRYLLFALTLLTLDWGLGVVGVFVHNTASRLVTGLIAGIVVALYVLPVLLAALLSVRYKTNLS